jgi:hypothetical protein
MRAGSRAHAESGKLLDTDQDELIIDLPHGEPHAVARLGRDRVEERRARRDRHQIHRVHAEPRHGLVSDQDHVRGRTPDDGSAHFVGRGANDRAPDAGGERRQQDDEQQDGERAMRKRPSIGSRRAPSRRL